MNQKNGLVQIALVWTLGGQLGSGTGTLTSMPGHRLCKAAAYELRRQMSQHGKAVIKAQHTPPEADARFSLDNAGSRVG